MAYTTTQLITKAYYLSGVVGQGLATVSASQITEGLELLNALLAIKTANNRLIPYYQLYEFDSEPGVETYFIPNLVEPETITFNLQQVRFSMYKQSRKVYFGSPRVDNINSLPFNFHVERKLGGADLYLYFKPNAELPIKIFGKFSLSQVALNQDLSLILDFFYIEYLRHALGEYICANFGITFQPQAQAKLNEYEKQIAYISVKDFSMSKMSTLQSQKGINWAYVNFPGWRPS